MLEKEFKFYLENQDALVKAHFGRYILIQGETLLGDFGTEIEAIILPLIFLWVLSLSNIVCLVSRTTLNIFILE